MTKGHRWNFIESARVKWEILNNILLYQELKNETLAILPPLSRHLHPQILSISSILFQGKFTDFGLFLAEFQSQASLGKILALRYEF